MPGTQDTGNSYRKISGRLLYYKMHVKIDKKKNKNQNFYNSSHSHKK